MRVLSGVGTMQAYLGRYEAAHAAFDEARGLAAALDAPALVAVLHANQGLVALQQGDQGAARHHLALAVERAREEGNRDRLQVALGNLAPVEVKEGQVTVARELLREALALNRAMDNLCGIAHYLPALAETYRIDGDPETAARLLGTVDAMLDRLNAALEIVERDTRDRTAAALRETMGDASFDAARAEGRHWPWQDAIALIGA